MSWKKIKELRLIIAGNKCEVCGKNGHLIGHHIIPRRHFHNLPEEVKLILCRMRHEECEKMMHEIRPFGNNGTELKIAKAVLRRKKNGKIHQDLDAMQLLPQRELSLARPYS